MTAGGGGSGAAGRVFSVAVAVHAVMNSRYRDTRFANKAEAVETLTPMLDADGKRRVSGYFIR